VLCPSRYFEDQLGWEGFEWNGVARFYFLFKDSLQVRGRGPLPCKADARADAGAGLA
jgi:hypothetical protein